MFFVCLAMCETEKEKNKFEKIYERYKKMMFRIAMGFLKDKSDAEDVVQECFIKIIRDLEKINLKSCNKTKVFIAVIVRHTCIDHLRKNKRSIETQEYEQCAEEGKAMSSIIEEPSEILINRQNYELLKQKIAELDFIYEEVFLLRYEAGFSDEDIASTLNISPNTVRTRLSRAKSILRSQLLKAEEVVL